MKNLLWLTSFRGESPATVAQIYGVNGWQIFPCIGKQPATRTGFNAASADPDQIADWWRQFPEANIGWSLPKGWFALDVDPRHGGDESLTAIYAQNRDAVPFTLEARTGSGGRHLIFRVPDGIEIRQGANFRPGLDTRLGGRGYLLIAPSVHPETKAAYEWTVLVEPQAPPRWLVDLVRVPLAKPRETIANVGSLPVAEMDKRQRYARAVLSGLCEEVRRAGKGQRNDTLNRAWYRIGSFRDAISKAEAREALLSAALDCGLSERESAMVLR